MPAAADCAHVSDTLSDDEIAAQIPDAWERDGDEIVRTFEFDSYLEGVGFGEVVQLFYYGLGFAVFSALCVVTLWGRELAAGRLSVAGGAAAVLVIAQLVVTRRAFGREGQLAVLGLSFVAFLLTAATVWFARNLDRGRLRYPGLAR